MAERPFSTMVFTNYTKLDRSSSSKVVADDSDCLRAEIDNDNKRDVLPQCELNSEFVHFGNEMASEGSTSQPMVEESSERSRSFSALTKHSVVRTDECDAMASVFDIPSEEISYDCLDCDEGEDSLVDDDLGVMFGGSSDVFVGGFHQSFLLSPCFSLESCA